MADTEIVLSERIASLVHSMGYEFVGCELSRQGREQLLRIYIDKDKGITLDDCTTVSRQVSAMLDVEDPIQGRYMLEVSSPGLNRPLFGVDQYRKFVGRRVRVRLAALQDGRRSFVGKLMQVNESDIHLLLETGEVIVPFSTITKGNIVAESLPIGGSGHH